MWEPIATLWSDFENVEIKKDPLLSLRICYSGAKSSNKLVALVAYVLSETLKISMVLKMKQLK
jgi:hypothetical protein